MQLAHGVILICFLQSLEVVGYSQVSVEAYDRVGLRLMPGKMNSALLHTAVA